MHTINYETLFKQVKKGVTYRQIAEKQNVSVRCVTRMVKRHRESGSIYPRTKSINLHDAYDRQLIEEAMYYKQLKFDSATGLRSLTQQEIHEHLQTKQSNLTFYKTKQLLKRATALLAESHLHMHHRPGERVEFDWGTLRIKIAQTMTTVHFAVFTFPYSQYKCIYAMPNQKGESFVKAWQQFIQEINGVPPHLLVDNMSIARDNHAAKEGDTIITPLFKQLMNHYGFRLSFCHPYCPNEKGNVENDVRWMKQKMKGCKQPNFESFIHLQQYITELVEQANKQKHRLKQDTRNQLLQHESATFLPVPIRKFSYFEETTRKVSRHATIRFQGNEYSVPEILKHETITIRQTKSTIRFLFENKTVATFSRTNKKGRRHFKLWHHLRTLKKKANAFQQSEAFRQMTRLEKKIFHHVFKSDCHEFLNYCSKIQFEPKKEMKRRWTEWIRLRQ
ncbi:Integrase core domain protein [Metalysinibacillus saudimassiliensis]|uniref:Integrase core domain protein n=1 Tax=Metalysinibacillus saudimassiliensis TaxID=1461583 RepID=A0A078M6K3_9BACL|nr:Integrase core domain protein [Metalysinibacillus saudimassiliensis]